MSRLQEFLLQAGRDLGVQVVAPYAVTLLSGEQIVADAWLPQLGSPNGMLVLSASDVAWRLQSVAAEQGYGVTSYLEPPDTEVYDVAAYAEMFADWGWNAQNSTRPPFTVPSDAPSNN